MFEVFSFFVNFLMVFQELIDAKAPAAVISKPELDDLCSGKNLDTVLKTEGEDTSDNGTKNKR
jgi:hypothetical protein